MILIRECSGFDELEACVQMQVETWGYDQSDVIPRKAFLVMQKIGGQIIGAFDTSLPGTSPQGEPAIAGWFCHVFARREGAGKKRRRTTTVSALPHAGRPRSLAQSRPRGATQAGTTT